MTVNKLRLPLPPQISTDPTVNASAQAWGTQVTDILSTSIAFGQDTVTWPGGQAFSTALNVNSGLASAPRAVLITQTSSLPGLTAFPVYAVTPGTTFVVQGWTIDNQLPANGSTATFYWLAIR